MHTSPFLVPLLFAVPVSTQEEPPSLESPSIVVFEARPRTLDAAESTKDATDDLVAIDTLALVKTASTIVLIESMARSRVDPDRFAKGIPEARLRHAIRMHRSMLDVRVATPVTDTAELARQLRLAARVTAALLADDPAQAMLEGGENPLVVDIPDDDPEILKARDEAQRRWPEFERAFAERSDPAEEFAVKFAHSEGKITEQLWLEVTQIADGVVQGKVGNSPIGLETLRLGADHSIPVGHVTDWLIASEERTVGGFTIAVVFRRSEEAAARWREERLRESAEKRGGPPGGQKGR